MFIFLVLYYSDCSRLMYKSKEWGIDTYKYTKYNTKNDHAIHSFTKIL